MWRYRHEASEVIRFGPHCVLEELQQVTLVGSLSRGSIPDSLTKSLLGAYNVHGVRAIQWGSDHESTAIAEYVKQYKVNLLQCGLFLYNSGLLGASPHCLERDDSLVEVKCPYFWRDSTICDVLQKSPKFLTLTASSELIINPEHDFYHQCHGQLHLSQRARLNFFVWLPSGSLRISVVRDENWGRDYIPVLLTFALDNLLPAYFKQLCPRDSC